MKMRLDQWMVEQGQAPSRSKAQELIESGAVKLLLNAQPVQRIKPSLMLELGRSDVCYELEILNASLLEFVSRGGLKLKGALEQLNLSVEGLTCLDIGQSTGGFTDCLLRHGAERVVGIDVGHGQLSPQLQSHSKVQFFEGFHLKQLESSDDPVLSPHQFDLVVVDLSFISSQVYYPVLESYMLSGQKLLALVKPQFEFGPDCLNKKGVLKMDHLFEKLNETIIERFDSSFWVIQFFESSLSGQDGNQEYFLYGEKK